MDINQTNSKGAFKMPNQIAKSVSETHYSIETLEPLEIDEVLAGAYASQRTLLNIIAKPEQMRLQNESGEIDSFRTRPLRFPRPRPRSRKPSRILKSSKGASTRRGLNIFGAGAGRAPISSATRTDTCTPRGLAAHAFQRLNFSGLHKTQE